MCGIACNNLRCSLYAGPVRHGGVCNPSYYRPEVQYAECYNAEIERKVNNQIYGPLHIRSMYFCPPKFQLLNCPGYYDPACCGC